MSCQVVGFDVYADRILKKKRLEWIQARHEEGLVAWNNLSEKEQKQWNDESYFSTELENFMIEFMYISKDDKRDIMRKTMNECVSAWLQLSQEVKNEWNRKVETLSKETIIELQKGVEW